jgi:hypothetical protein
MIASGMRDLADIVQERGELGHPALPRHDTKAIADGQDEADNLAAVLAGVGVVGVDDVPEEKRRAPVGSRELERGVESLTTLSREEAEQQDEREREEECTLLDGGGDREAESDRSDQRIEEKGRRDRSQEVPGTHTERHPLESRRTRQIEGELCEKGPDQDGAAVPGGVWFSSGREHERCADRECGVAREDSRPGEREPAAHDIDQTADSHAAHDEERHVPGREEKEHRHEGKRGRQRESAAELERE